MTDIVERLRGGITDGTQLRWMVTPIHQEAADEITRLRAAVADAYRAGQEDMRERAAQEMDCGCEKAPLVDAATTKTERWMACPRSPCSREEAAFIRALPIKEISDD